MNYIFSFITRQQHQHGCQLVLKKKELLKKKSEYHDRSGHIDSKVKEEVVSFVSQLMNRTDYEVSVPV